MIRPTRIFARRPEAVNWIATSMYQADDPLPFLWFVIAAASFGVGLYGHAYSWCDCGVGFVSFAIGTWLHLAAIVVGGLGARAAYRRIFWHRRIAAAIAMVGIVGGFLLNMSLLHSKVSCHFSQYNHFHHPSSVHEDVVF